MKKTGKCICQLCTCGRHRCPQNRGSIGQYPAKSVEPNTTQYQLAYEKHPYQPVRPSLKPAQQDNNPRTPMDINSTYKDTFLKHESTSKRKPFRPRYVPVSSDTPMAIISSYRDDFRKKNGKRSDSFKPEVNYARATAKVEKDTMYRETFKEHGVKDWAWCRAAPIRHKECIESFGSASPTNLEATSVMKNDFRHHEKPIRAQLHRPQPENRIEGGAFQRDTSYKKEFNQKEISPVHAIRPKEYQAPTARFEGTSTVKSDFAPHPEHRRDPPFKPPMNYQPCKTEFDGSTTTGETYRQWPAQKMEKPQWARQKAYEPTPDNNLYSSSYQSDYRKPSKYERAQLVKPSPQDKELLHGQTESDVPKVTHYREQFIPFSKTTPARSFKMIQHYEPPAERIMAESVYQASYTGERVPPAQAIVPQQRRSSDEAPHSIDFHSTYADTFKAERPASCPAKELVTASDEFGHIGFRNGHQYYLQKSPRRCKTPKEMDPIFPATPESQKTDRERSSSRPTSATRRSTRSPTKMEQRSGGAAARSPRPTTPRSTGGSSRPGSARKENKPSAHQTTATEAKPQRPARPGSAKNQNNSNGNGGKPARPSSARSQSSHVTPAAKKVDSKAGNRNNSNANSVKPAAKPKAAPAAAASSKADTNANMPPPIRRPKKDTNAPPATTSAPATTGAAAAATAAAAAAATPSTAASIATTTAATTTPATSIAPTTSAPTPAKSTPAATTATGAPATVTSAPTASTGAGATSTPAAPPVVKPASAAAPSAPTATTTATTTAPTPQVKPTEAAVSSAPVTTTAAVTAPPATTTATTSDVPLVPLVPDSRPTEKQPPAPLSTTAPTPPTMSTTPLLADLGAPSPVVAEPIVAAAKAAPAAAAPPPASAPAAQPASQSLPITSDLLDLDLLEAQSSPSSSAAQAEPVADGPKMPVIAPPPAPAQPVVRMGNARDVNLLQ